MFFGVVSHGWSRSTYILCAVDVLTTLGNVFSSEYTRQKKPSLSELIGQSYQYRVSPLAKNSMRINAEVSE